LPDSPDLNIIENGYVWQRLKRQLQNDATCIATVDLKARIRHLWENLPVNYIQSLYFSISWKAVLKNNGNVTKY